MTSEEAYLNLEHAIRDYFDTIAEEPSIPIHWIVTAGLTRIDDEATYIRTIQSDHLPGYIATGLLSWTQDLYGPDWTDQD